MHQTCLQVVIMSEKNNTLQGYDDTEKKIVTGLNSAVVPFHASMP